MNLSEEDKKRIQEEEEYRETLRAKHTEESKYRQEIIAKKSKGKSVFYFITHLFKWWLIVGLIILIIGLISFFAGNWSSPSNIQNSTSTSISKEQSVSDIEVNSQKVSVGDSADSVFAIITERYKLDSPTVKEGKVTHHYLIGKILYDMTFERNETGDYYILSKIVIKDNDYQTPAN